MIVETVKLWENRNDVTLTAYGIEPMGFLPKKTRPGILICPGGAYMTLATDTEGDIIAAHFVGAGYQAFVLHYTVAVSAGGNDTRYPAQLFDIAKAMMVLHENAKKWNLDKDAISVMGFSAGAHLAATLATRWHEPMLSERLGAPQETFKPVLAVLLYGVLDYVIQFPHNKAHPMPVMPGEEQVDINLPFFGTATPTQEQLRAASPALLVSEKTPPCFLACAQNDMMVTPMNSISMVTALVNAGIPCEFHMFERGEHGFSLGQNIFKKDDRTADRFAARWVEAAEMFITHHLHPETAEKDVWGELEIL